MLHPANLVRLAVYAGVAFLIRAILREAHAASPGTATLLPPPRQRRSSPPKSRR